KEEASAVPAALSGRQKLKHRVFEDLWNKGYYITSGAYYGAHFCIYAADPEYCHSTSAVFICGEVRGI
ncbi:unnamed protein product, partial [Chrysoparadoxa australica]